MSAGCLVGVHLPAGPGRGLVRLGDRLDGRRLTLDGDLPGHGLRSRCGARGVVVLSGDERGGHTSEGEEEGPGQGQRPPRPAVARRARHRYGLLLERPVERLDEGGRGRVPVHRVLRQGAGEHGVHLLREPDSALGGRRHRLVDVGGRLGGLGAALERTPPGQELVRDNRERIAVAGRGGLAPRGLLRGEVARRAQDRSGRRHAQGLVHEAGDPEVDDLEPAGCVEEKIRRLHVAMHDPVRVRGVERLRGLGEPGDRSRRLDRTLHAARRGSRRAGTP